MNDLRVQLKQLFDRIDALSLRERAIVFVGVLGILYAVADTLVFPALSTTNKSLEQQVRAKREQAQFLQKRVQERLAEQAQDPDERNRARLAELEAKLEAHGASFSTVASGLVSPSEMTKLVGEMLARNRALQVVRVENLAPTPLIDRPQAQPQPQGQVQPAAKAPGQAPLLRHGLRVEVEGRYADLVAYLRALEALPWRVFWGEAHLSAENAPMSRLTVVMYTLSPEQAWIGM